MSDVTTFGDLYRDVRKRFREANLETPDLDARLLMAAALEVSPSDLILREDDKVGDEQRLLALKYADQRLIGLPVGRILGEREFWGLRFRLNEETLEPRPDTETLVQAVLDRVSCEGSLVLADIGTGTGAIAVALLTELPNAVCAAIDISERALECARGNAARHGVAERLLPVRSDYASSLGAGVDWVLSNPPYIRTKVVEGLSREVREHDPGRALDGGTDGLDAYREIVPQALQCLSPDGRIALEIGFDQEQEVSELLRQCGFLHIEIIQDLAGNDRVVLAMRRESGAF
ncbi:peptide chain release factor N(5)-glutamine methyltransferase [Labrenzia polysiphoniae]|uniref:Release factor glutamine methyltransferase n=1 Tax=Roseibium polysiphoniae TaxID=2571221 RepID=A0ABR9CBE1_9HYPH|nr:peptide chain release factor N(5)-glutamine methyltransferase [Roseibium polysiphoniae]